MAKIDIDFRLSEVTMELHTLEQYLQTLEEQVSLISAREKELADGATRMGPRFNDDFDVDVEWQIYEFTTEHLLPRFFRGPFLISLYAVYESSTIEIANLIKQAKNQSLSLKDIRGNDFLDQAKKYYKHVLDFPLNVDRSTWERIKTLSTIRNALAHANGRIEMLKNGAKSEMQCLFKKDIGIDEHMGYIVVSKPFVQETFRMVKVSLTDLIDRFKAWDDSLSQA